LKKSKKYICTCAECEWCKAGLNFKILVEEEMSMEKPKKEPASIKKILQNPH